MPISANVKLSPGWWLQSALTKLQARQPRLEMLDAWHRGEPPAPEAVRQVREVFREFEAEATTNFAELIVGSIRERMSVRDIRTSASGSIRDDVAQRLWDENNMGVEFGTIIENFLALGDAYAMVGVDEETGAVIATAEDPRQVVTFHDPVRQSRVRAALKVFRDELEEKAFAVLMVRGSEKDGTSARLYVASSPSPQGQKGVSYDVRQWDWEPGRERELATVDVPVVRFRNRRGVGEFEPHLNILRRLNRLVFQMTVIAIYQAYRQRAITLDETDDQDEVEIQGAFQEKLGLDDLDDVLTSDPGSWFLLPRGAKVWESNQADMQGILSAVKDDVMRLAAVTRRPMAIFAPDNQSAQGANFTREGLTFAVEDKIARATEGAKDMISLMLQLAGESGRAARAGIIIGWNPTERFSLSEKASATSQVANALPRRTVLRQVWQMTPAESDQVENEAADEALLLRAALPDGGGPEVQGGLSAKELAKVTDSLEKLIRPGVGASKAAEVSAPARVPQLDASAERPGRQ